MQVKYNQDHQYIIVEDGVGTVGITKHAQEKLNEVTFVDMPGTSRLRSSRKVEKAQPLLSVNDRPRNHGTVQCDPAQARQIDIFVTLLNSEHQPEKGGSQIRTPR